MRFLVVFVLTGCGPYWKENAGYLPGPKKEAGYTFVGVRPQTGVLTGEPFRIQTR